MEFEDSKEFRVTDPIYSADDCRNALFDEIRPGKWEAVTAMLDGEYVAILAYHKSMSKKEALESLRGNFWCDYFDADNHQMGLYWQFPNEGMIIDIDDTAFGIYLKNGEEGVEAILLSDVDGNLEELIDNFEKIEWV